MRRYTLHSRPRTCVRRAWKHSIPTPPSSSRRPVGSLARSLVRSRSPPPRASITRAPHSRPPARTKTNHTTPYATHSRAAHAHANSSSGTRTPKESQRRLASSDTQSPELNHVPAYFSSALATQPRMSPSSNVSLNTNAAFALVVASADAAASATATFIGIVKCGTLYIPGYARRAMRACGCGVVGMNEERSVRARATVSVAGVTECAGGASSRCDDWTLCAANVNTQHHIVCAPSRAARRAPHSIAL